MQEKETSPSLHKIYILKFYLRENIRYKLILTNSGTGNQNGDDSHKILNCYCWTIVCPYLQNVSSTPWEGQRSSIDLVLSIKNWMNHNGTNIPIWRRGWVSGNQSNRQEGFYPPSPFPLSDLTQFWYHSCIFFLNASYNSVVSFLYIHIFVNIVLTPLSISKEILHYQLCVSQPFLQLQEKVQGGECVFLSSIRILLDFAFMFLHCLFSLQ